MSPRLSDALGELKAIARRWTGMGTRRRTMNHRALLNEGTVRRDFLSDGANRLIERVDGLVSDEQTPTTFLYDDVGKLLEEKDGRDTGVAFDVRNTYDALNRLETTTAPRATRRRSSTTPNASVLGIPPLRKARSAPREDCSLATRPPPCPSSPSDYLALIRSPLLPSPPPLCLETRLPHPPNCQRTIANRAPRVTASQFSLLHGSTDTILPSPTPPQDTIS